MLEALVFPTLLIIAFILLFILNNMAAIRRYTLAQFHLNLKFSNMSNENKIKLAKKYGLSFDPEDI